VRLAPFNPGDHPLLLALPPLRNSWARAALPISARGLSQSSCARGQGGSSGMVDDDDLQEKLKYSSSPRVCQTRHAQHLSMNLYNCADPQVWRTHFFNSHGHCHKISTIFSIFSMKVCVFYHFNFREESPFRVSKSVSTFKTSGLKLVIALSF
jgi:hypothetical protein